MIELEVGQRTDIGRRRDHNEDYLAVHRPRSPAEASRRGYLLVIADGMGGHAAGEVASRVAVDPLAAAYYAESAEEGVEEALRRALLSAHEAVTGETKRDPAHAGMGTTVAVAVVRGDELTVANVGDCRVYLMRQGELAQLTRDHSWVAELLESGRITPDEAAQHPMRNLVTRFIGVEEDLQLDACPRQQLQAGDTILLCTDGLWGMVPLTLIRSLLDAGSPQSSVDALVVAANNAGGHDNISAIVCQVRRLAPDADDATTQLMDPPSSGRG